MEDVSGFVAEQRQHLQTLEKLWTPTEHVFSPGDS